MIVKHELKPLVAIQGVRRPPSKGAGQLEASLVRVRQRPREAYAACAEAAC